MNDHRAIIVGVCEATPTFQSNPVVYTTYTRAKNFAPQERKILSYILAKTEPGVSPEVVAGRITATTGLGAKTSDAVHVDDDQLLPAIHGHPVQLRDHGACSASWSARRSPGRPSTTSRSRTSSSSAP